MRSNSGSSSPEYRNLKSLTTNFVANSTYYLGVPSLAWATSLNTRRFQFFKIGTVVEAFFNVVHSSTPSNEPTLAYLRNVTTGVDYLLGNIDWSLTPTNSAYGYHFKGLSIPISNLTDQWTVKLVTAVTMVTLPTSVYTDIIFKNQ